MKEKATLLKQVQEPRKIQFFIMNVERDEEGKTFNPFLSASPKCWPHTNSHDDCVSWAGQGGKPGFLQGLGVEQLALSFSQVTLTETAGDSCAEPYLPVCHPRCPERLEPMLLTAWCAQMHLVVNANWTFSQVSSSCTKNVCVSQLTATGRGKKKPNKPKHPKKRCFSSSLPRQSSSHSCPWHTWLLAELRLVLFCRHRMKHAQCASFQQECQQYLGLLQMLLCVCKLLLQSLGSHETGSGLLGRLCMALSTEPFGKMCFLGHTGSQYGTRILLKNCIFKNTIVASHTSWTYAKGYV